MQQQEQLILVVVVVVLETILDITSGAGGKGVVILSIPLAKFSIYNNRFSNRIR
jgi:hypothetical protein